jgi:3-phosphoshikimate 1-carboxyvinyltransferase
MEYLDLAPVRRASGTVKLPGSKSISNRILLLAAIAEGETRIHDVLDSDDTRYMLNALRKLGVEWTQDDSQALRVTGAQGVFPNKHAELFLGNAGTAVRPLTAVLALCGGEYKVDGVARMRERPIGDLVDALKSFGAAITYQGAAGFPPLAIHPARSALART